MEYIRIINWAEHQHYKHREPPWIKLHCRLLDNDRFDCLQDDSKLLLIMLWLFNARRGDGKIRADEKWLAKKLPVKKIRLQPLIRTGFIEVYQDDSIPQAESKQNADTEKRRVEKSRVEKYTSEFEIFWKEYPTRWIPESDKHVKIGKDLAWQQWRKIGDDAHRHILGIISRMKSGKAVPDPWRWLRDKKWKDYDPPKPPDPKIEAERAERERQKQREEYSKHYRSKTTEELKEDFKSYGCFSHRWLIKEILAEREINE